MYMFCENVQRLMDKPMSVWRGSSYWLEELFSRHLYVFVLAIVEISENQVWTVSVNVTSNFHR